MTAVTALTPSHLPCMAGKFCALRFTPSGRLLGAHLETYLLEKCRVVQVSAILAQFWRNSAQLF